MPWVTSSIVHQRGSEESSTYFRDYDNIPEYCESIGTASANTVESDLGCTSSIYFDNMTWTLYNVSLT